MTKPTVKAVLLSPQRELGTKPLLVVGPSLGTSTVLWTETAALLGDEYDVIGWDLPGHGISPAATEGFDVAELADAVVDLVDSVSPGARFHYAGVSLGGATGLQLGIKHGDRLRTLSVQCTGAKLGTPEGWLERAETVRSLGTPVMIQGSAERWFAKGFMDRQPDISSRLLHALRDADRFSYSFCCEALAGFDVREQLGSITVPTQAIAGVEDSVAPPSFAEAVASGVRAGGSFAVAEALDGVGHLAPAETPAVVAGLMRNFMKENGL
ncbi:MAG TPA: alpha/beta fold hydrolase [Paenarthrobacter sp.]|nr:alpha/beta fold hydrolase [Paenarthrobacter sp.]